MRAEVRNSLIAVTAAILPAPVGRSEGNGKASLTVHSIQRLESESDQGAVTGMLGSRDGGEEVGLSRIPFKHFFFVCLLKVGALQVPI